MICPAIKVLLVLTLRVARLKNEVIRLNNLLALMWAQETEPEEYSRTEGQLGAAEGQLDSAYYQLCRLGRFPNARSVKKAVQIEDEMLAEWARNL